jgi:hypothetical protein
MKTFRSLTMLLMGILPLLACAGGLCAREEPELLWTVTPPGAVEFLDGNRIEASDIAIDGSGNVFLAGESSCHNAEERPSVAAHDERGELLWFNSNTEAEFSQLCLAPDGSIYAAGNSLLAKIDRAGNEVWSAPCGGAGSWWSRRLAAAPDGGVVALSRATSSLGWECQTARYGAGGDLLWEVTYRGRPEEYRETPIAVVADDAGNCYVLSESLSAAGKFEYATIKYSAAGDELWVARYRGQEDEHAYPGAIGLSRDGSIYVTGSVRAEGRDPATTLKYNRDGDLLWARSFEEMVPMGLVTDGTGGVCIAGRGQGDRQGDAVTVKYSAAGEELWARGEEGDIFSSEWPPRVGIDAGDNIFVSWIREHPDTGYDTHTVKYDPGGEPVWTSRYNGSGSYNDYLRVMAVDARGRVVLSCTSAISTAPFVGHATVGYDENGERSWIVETRDPTDVFEEPAGLAADGEGHIYLAGRSSAPETRADYLTIKYSPGGEELWRRRFGLPGILEERPCGAGVDSQGNVYVSGTGKGGGEDHFLTVKYDPAGELLWSALHEDAEISDEAAQDMAVDPEGNVYVAGHGYHEGRRGYVTVKYAPDGRREWRAVLRPPGESVSSCLPEALAVASDGSIYVTGQGGELGTCYTVKYAPDGRELWVDEYGNPDRMKERPAAICIDREGNVCVAGVTYLPYGEGSEGSADVLIFALSPGGEMLWDTTYNGPGRHDDGVREIAADGDGNVYIAGTSVMDDGAEACVTVKLDARGNTLWEARYAHGSRTANDARGLRLDREGNAYVVAMAADRQHIWEGSACVVLKYDPRGRLLWAAEVVSSDLINFTKDPVLQLHPAGGVVAACETYHAGPCFHWPRMTLARLTSTALPPADFTRGDSTADGAVDISDAVCALLYLFAAGETPCRHPGCLDALDANDDGTLDITDPIYLLGYLFLGGTPPPPPVPGACGPDPTPDPGAPGEDLGCDFHPCEEV